MKAATTNKGNEWKKYKRKVKRESRMRKYKKKVDKRVKVPGNIKKK